VWQCIYISAQKIFRPPRIYLHSIWTLYLHWYNYFYYYYYHYFYYYFYDFVYLHWNWPSASQKLCTCNENYNTNVNASSAARSLKLRHVDLGKYLDGWTDHHGRPGAVNLCPSSVWTLICDRPSIVPSLCWNGRKMDHTVTSQTAYMHKSLVIRYYRLLDQRTNLHSFSSAGYCTLRSSGAPLRRCRVPRFDSTRSKLRQ